MELVSEHDIYRNIHTIKYHHLNILISPSDISAVVNSPRSVQTNAIYAGLVKSTVLQLI